MDIYLQCSKNNIIGCNFLVEIAFFFVNTEEYMEYYTLIDLPVHGAQIEPSPIFIACFNCELYRYLSTCNLFSILLLYKLSITVPIVKYYNSNTINHKMLKLWLPTLLLLWITEM